MIRSVALAGALASLASTGCRDWDALSARYDAGTPDSGVSCPSGRGPEMVRVSLAPNDGAALIDFCIDSTEVTRAQYAHFLASVGQDVSGQPPECGPNTSYLAPVTGAQDLPVAHVDHCDARAFCQWAGKRLCGGIERDTSWSLSSPIQSEWFFACSQGGALQFPYGNAAELGACAFLDNAASGPLPTAALSACEGGFPGLFDMTGNVWEWIDQCVSNPDGGPSVCRFQGGSYKQIHDKYPCGIIGQLPPMSTAPDVGIRCCASLD